MSNSYHLDNKYIILETELFMICLDSDGLQCVEHEFVHVFETLSCWN